MEIVSDHGWPKSSLGEEGDENAFDSFKNERDYIAQSGRMRTTVAAMDWAAREIERLRKEAAHWKAGYDDMKSVACTAIKDMR